MKKKNGRITTAVNSTTHKKIWIVGMNSPYMRQQQCYRFANIVTHRERAVMRSKISSTSGHQCIVDVAPPPSPPT